MYQKFLDALKEYSDRDLYIILHHNADPDAICAAEALGKLFVSQFPSQTYTILSDDINVSATRIQQEMKIAVENNLPTVDQDTSVVITVDTANLSQLGKFADWYEARKPSLFVIDHHDTSELAESSIASIVETEAASTCVMIAKLYQAAKLSPSPEIATLLISGHLYDSRRFLYGSSAEVFDIMSQLIRWGGDFELANNLLQNEMSQGEKIARFKAAQRIKYKIINGTIVVTSRVGAFEASAARSFIGIGADVTFVLAKKENELRGSARSLNAANVNVGDILSKLSEEYNGTGGGHAAAAGFNISPCPSTQEQKSILQRFVDLVEEYLNQGTNS